ncbi:MAG TPA: NIPSNAP family protein [Aeromonadales bacterium]|nr:NIPSNAP family protein [Aeromonadales bacterium]
MVTCFLKYCIDPEKIKEFTHYGKLWIDLVNRKGGIHHGYLIPHEGPNNVGYASFSFPSLAEYEVYRNKIPGCPDCQKALAYARKSKCIVSFERNFYTPVFEGINDKARLFYKGK